MPRSSPPMIDTSLPTHHAAFNGRQSDSGSKNSTRTVRDPARNVSLKASFVLISVSVNGRDGIQLCLLAVELSYTALATQPRAMAVAA